LLRTDAGKEKDWRKVFASSVNLKEALCREKRGGGVQFAYWPWILREELSVSARDEKGETITA